MKDNNMKEKLDAHWDYIEKIVKLSYELGQLCNLDWKTFSPLVGELYLSAMHHGYKHAIEEIEKRKGETK